jgi:MFS family permease
VLVLGRLIVGLAIGFSSMTIPVYIAEAAPAAVRGRLVTINCVFITAGQFIAGMVDGGFAEVPQGWRWVERGPAEASQRDAVDLFAFALEQVHAGATSVACGDTVRRHPFHARVAALAGAEGAGGAGASGSGTTVVQLVWDHLNSISGVAPGAKGADAVAVIRRRGGAWSL